MPDFVTLVAPPQYAVNDDMYEWGGGDPRRPYYKHYTLIAGRKK